MMTDIQRKWIEDMNRFCDEKFDLSYSRQAQEATEYIDRNLEEYQMLLLTGLVMNGGY